jgi:hypothetical protein
MILRRSVGRGVKALATWKRLRVGRGRGRGNNRDGRNRDRGRSSPTTSRIDFNAIVGALTPHERKRHQEECLCFKCHRKGRRLFMCPELKGREAEGAPMKQK